MGNERRLFIDSAWFIYIIVPVASGVLGVPVSIYLLTEADGDSLMRGMGFSVAPGCAVVGFLIYRLGTWLANPAKRDKT